MCIIIRPSRVVYDVQLALPGVSIQGVLFPSLSLVPTNPVSLESPADRHLSCLGIQGTWTLEWKRDMRPDLRRRNFFCDWDDSLWFRSCCRAFVSWIKRRMKMMEQRRIIRGEHGLVHQFLERRWRRERRCVYPDYFRYPFNDFHG